MLFKVMVVGMALGKGLGVPPPGVPHSDFFFFFFFYCLWWGVLFVNLEIQSVLWCIRNRVNNEEG